MTATIAPGLAVDDTAVVTLRSAGGALGVVEAAQSLPGGRNVVEIYGTAGACLLDYDAGTVRYRSADYPIWQTHDVTGLNGLEGCLAHFADAVRGLQTLAVTGQDWFALWRSLNRSNAARAEERAFREDIQEEFVPHVVVGKSNTGTTTTSSGVRLVPSEASMLREVGIENCVSPQTWQISAGTLRRIANSLDVRRNVIDIQLDSHAPPQRGQHDGLTAGFADMKVNPFHSKRTCVVFTISHCFPTVLVLIYN